MKNRWGSYEDYAREIDEDAERKAHEAGECEGYPICFICLDERDVDDMADHVNNELDKPGAGVDVNGKTLTGELAQPHTRVERK